MDIRCFTKFRTSDIPSIDWVYHGIPIFAKFTAALGVEWLIQLDLTKLRDAGGLFIAPKIHPQIVHCFSHGFNVFQFRLLYTTIWRFPRIQVPLNHLF